MDILFERILLLTKVPWFASLRTDQLRFIAPVLEPVAWVRGEIIFHRGEPGAHMYLVTAGSVGISLDEALTSNNFVARMGPGECFGEMGILDDLPRSATAIALEDTDALGLEKEKLRGLLLTYPELGISMLKALSRRLRAANESASSPIAEPKTT